MAAPAQPAPLDCARVPLDGACDVLEHAKKAMQSTATPTATLLPVEPLQTFPAGALDAAVQRRIGNLNPYRISSSDFDIAFFTPVLTHNVVHGRQTMTPSFGDWSDYFSSDPPVLVVRVTPKMTERFLTKLARGAAYTQGASLPPIKHFNPGFSRLQAFCGDIAVAPIHPFVLNQRVSETDAVHEGLYVFEPGAFGPQCKVVKLVLYSEKASAK